MSLAVFLITTLVCGGIVAAISFLGAKEQSFEEAVAEQKKKLEAEKGAKKAARANANNAADGKANKAKAKKAAKKAAANNANGQPQKVKKNVVTGLIISSSLSI